MRGKSPAVAIVQALQEFRCRTAAVRAHGDHQRGAAVRGSFFDHRANLRDRFLAFFGPVFAPGMVFNYSETALGMLDDLSLREFNLLIKLEEYEQQHPRKEDENELQRARRFWDDFVVDVEQNLNIPREELEAMLARLIRSGCYEPFVGAYFDYTGGMGKLTPLYYRLKELVGNKLDEHDG